MKTVVFIVLLIAVAQITEALSDPFEAKGITNKRSLLPYFKKVANSHRHKVNMENQTKQERQHLQRLHKFLAKVIESFTPRLANLHDRRIRKHWMPVFK